MEDTRQLIVELIKLERVPKLVVFCNYDDNNFIKECTSKFCDICEQVIFATVNQEINLASSEQVKVKHLQSYTQVLDLACSNAIDIGEILYLIIAKGTNLTSLLDTAKLSIIVIPRHESIQLINDKTCVLDVGKWSIIYPNHSNGMNTFYIDKWKEESCIYFQLNEDGICDLTRRYPCDSDTSDLLQELYLNYVLKTFKSLHIESIIYQRKSIQDICAIARITNLEITQQLLTFLESAGYVKKVNDDDCWILQTAFPTLQSIESLIDSVTDALNKDAQSLVSYCKDLAFVPLNTLKYDRKSRINEQRNEIIESILNQSEGKVNLLEISSNGRIVNESILNQINLNHEYTFHHIDFQCIDSCISDIHHQSTFNVVVLDMTNLDKTKLDVLIESIKNLLTMGIGYLIIFTTDIHVTFGHFGLKLAEEWTGILSSHGFQVISTLNCLDPVIVAKQDCYCQTKWLAMTSNETDLQGQQCRFGSDNIVTLNINEVHQNWSICNNVEGLILCWSITKDSNMDNNSQLLEIIETIEKSSSNIKYKYCIIKADNTLIRGDVIIHPLATLLSSYTVHFGYNTILISMSESWNTVDEYLRHELYTTKICQCVLFYLGKRYTPILKTIVKYGMGNALTLDRDHVFVVYQREPTSLSSQVRSWLREIGVKRIICVGRFEQDWIDSEEWKALATLQEMFNVDELKRVGGEEMEIGGCVVVANDNVDVKQVLYLQQLCTSTIFAMYLQTSSTIKDCCQVNPPWLLPAVWFSLSLAKYRMHHGLTSKFLIVDVNLQSVELLLRCYVESAEGTPKQVEEEPASSSSTLNSGHASSTLNSGHAVCDDIIMELVSEVTGLDPNDIDASKTLQDIGLDSLMIVELHNKLEQTFGIEFSATVLFDYSTPRDLAAYFAVGPGRRHSRRQSSWTTTFTDDIAIVGMSCRIGNAKTPDNFWDGLISGKDWFREIPKERFDVQDYAQQIYTKHGSFIDDIDQFDCMFFEASPAEAELMDPQQRLLLQLTWEAFENAGIPADAMRGARAGCFVGICGHDYEEIISVPKDVAASYFVTSNLASLASGRVSYFFGLHGPSISVDTACSSSLAAVHFACQSLRLQESRLAVAAGVQLIVAPRTYVNYCQAKMLSPTGKCRTFDEEADGFVRGEGGAVIILKKLADAVLDGDNVLAIIKGSYINQDGRSSGLTVPNGAAQEMLIKRALQASSVSPNDVDYIETHGTGTVLGDPIELNTLYNVFNKGRTTQLAVGSVKANIGHLEGAAGIAGLMKLVLALRAKQFPPQVNFKKINEHIASPDFFKISSTAETWDGGKTRIGGVSSFGVSGTNVHVIVEESHTEYGIERCPRISMYILTISAKTTRSLDKLANAYELLIQQRPDIFPDIAYTSNIGRAHLKNRIAIVAKDHTDAIQQLQSRGSISGSPSEPPKACFLFTGQGSAYFGMAEQLYNTHSLFHALIDQCSDIVEELLEKSLLDMLYRDKSLMDNTTYSQVALFSIEYSLATLLLQLGIYPAVLLGHSFGEYVGACISKAFTLSEAMEIVIARSKLAQDLVKSGEWKMLAIRENVERARELINSWGYTDEVEVSCINGPTQTVLSGPKEILYKIRPPNSTILNIPFAYHSTHVKPIVGKLRQFMSKHNSSQLKYPMISCITGEKLNESDLDANYWASHCVQPVNFIKALNKAKELGCTVFIEVGPTPTLCSLGNDGDTRYDWINTMTKEEPSWEAFLFAVAKLYTKGFSINFAELHGEKKKRVELPLYPFDTQRCWALPKQWNHNAEMCLVGDLVCETTKEFIFQRTLDVRTRELAYLEGHAFREKIVFPGAGFVEMMLQALQKIRPEVGMVELENVVFERPLVLDKPLEVQTTIGKGRENLDEPAFEIYSRENETWVLHSTGQVKYHRFPKESWISPEDLVRKLKRVNCDTVYKHFRETDGVNYKPSFELIYQLWVGESEAISYIGLDETTCLSSYIVHPAVIDNAFQTLFSIYICNNITSIRQPFIVIGVDRVTASLDEAHANVLCMAKVREFSDKYVFGDLQICSSNGKVLFQVTGYRAIVAGATLQVQTKLDDNLFYRQDWTPDKYVNKESVLLPRSFRESKDPLLIVSTEGDDIGRLVAEGILVTAGLPSVFIKVSRNGTLTPKILETALRNHRNFFATLYLLGFPDPILDQHPETIKSSEDIEFYTRRATGGLLLLAQDIIRSNRNIKRAFMIVTRGCEAVPGFGVVTTPFPSILGGAAKSLQAEHPELRVSCVFVDPGDVKSLQVSAILHEFLSEDGLELQALYSKGQRYIARIARHSPPRSAFTVKPGCTYLITGGMGGVGLELTDWLVRKGASNITILTRSSRPERQTKLNSLFKGGAEVNVVPCDVANPAQLQKALTSLAHPLAGVFHSAGVVNDAAVLNQNWETISSVFRSKVMGTWNLHDQTKHLSLDHFVLFSSVASHFGVPGQFNYSAANAFLDSMAHYRCSLGLPALSINWGAFDKVGVAVGKKLAPGILRMSPQKALEALAGVLSSGVTQVSIAEINWEALWMFQTDVIRRWAHLFSPKESDIISSSPRGHKQNVGIPVQNERKRQFNDSLLSMVTSTIKKLTGFQDIPHDAVFQQLGLDSIMLIELRNNVQRLSGVQIPMTSIFDFPTSSSLAKHIEQVSAEQALNENHLESPINGMAQENEYQDTSSESNSEWAGDEVAIVGMSCRFGEASTPEDFWNLLSSGGDIFREIPVDRLGPSPPSEIYTKHGAFVKSSDCFDYTFFDMTEKESGLMDPQQRLLMECCWEALEDANISAKGLTGSKSGIYIAMSSNDYALLLEREGVVKRTLQTQPLSYIVGNIPSTAAGRLSHFFDVNGPCITVDTACSSSLTAIHLAMCSLRSRESDLNIVGGANLIFVPDKFSHYCKAKMLSKDGRCRAFDMSADGYSRGEGVGVVILKRLSDAMKDRDYVLAVLNGGCISHSGLGSGLGNPSGGGQIKMLRNAIDYSKVSPMETVYVEAHGSGTLVGDAVELNALEAVYGAGNTGRGQLIVGSVKANVGHTEAAAGMASLIKVVLSFQKKWIPPQPHFSMINPYIKNPKFFRIPGPKGLPWPAGRLRQAGITSMGYGGTNVHLILQDSEEQKKPVPKRLTPELCLFTVSAKSWDSLKKLLLLYSTSEWQQEAFESIAYTTNVGRSHFDYRHSILADSLLNLREQLIRRAGQAPCTKSSNKIIGFLLNFETTSVGAGAELYRRIPRFRSLVDECVPSLSSNTTWNSERSPLDNLDNRISHLVLPYSMAKLVIDIGVNPSYVAGVGSSHITAQCLAGSATLASRIAALTSTSNAGKKQISFAGSGERNIDNLDAQRAKPFGNTAIKLIPLRHEIPGASDTAIAYEASKGSMDYLAQLESLKRVGCDLVINFGCNIVQDPVVINYPCLVGDNEWEDILRLLSALYDVGLHLDFNKLYENKMYSRVSLPKYPFEKRRVWFNLD